MNPANIAIMPKTIFWKISGTSKKSIKKNWCKNLFSSGRPIHSGTYCILRSPPLKVVGITFVALWWHKWCDKDLPAKLHHNIVERDIIILKAWTWQCVALLRGALCMYRYLRQQPKLQQRRRQPPSSKGRRGSSSSWRLWAILWCPGGFSPGHL